MMACVTLKRSLDFDPLHSPTRSAKRRRCALVSQPASPKPSTSAVFDEAVPKMTQDQLLASVREEVRRLQRRKQLHYEKHHSESEAMCDSGPSSPVSMPRSPSPQNLGQKDKPLFTLKQVTMICERMIREREDEVREAYDQVLVTKLAEQYDSFVKFTFDQVQRRFEAETPSYLS